MNRYLFFSKTTLGNYFMERKKPQSMPLKTVISKTRTYPRRAAGAYRCKSMHNMIEERSLGVKTPVESKIKRPCRGTGGRGVGRDAIRYWAPYSVEMKVLRLIFWNPKFMFRNVPIVKAWVAVMTMLHVARQRAIFFSLSVLRNLRGKNWGGGGCSSHVTCICLYKWQHLNYMFMNDSLFLFLWIFWLYLIVISDRKFSDSFDVWIKPPFSCVFFSLPMDTLIRIYVTTVWLRPVKHSMKCPPPHFKFVMSHRNLNNITSLYYYHRAIFTFDNNFSFISWISLILLSD